LQPILGDGFGDGVVKTSVKGVKFSRGDGRFRLIGQLGDGLTNTP
jgi:hypothetical protein